MPRSQILFDFGEDVSVYTTEGTVNIYKADTGEAVEVSKDRMVNITPPGDFGEVAKFDEADLSADLLAVKELLPAYEAPVEGSSGGSTGLIAGVIVAVIVLGGLIFGLIRRRR